MKQMIILLLFVLANTFTAQIIYVPTDYKIIQDAIDDAKDGDIIIIEEGNYVQQINFKGKAITVASEFYLDGDTSHISKTIIDGIFLPQKDSSSLVYFDNGEDSSSVLCGFTLQNGRGTKIINPINPNNTIIVGGAIFVDSSGAKIEHNIIRNNSIVIDNYLSSTIKTFGGGLEVNFVPKSKSLLIRGNTFKDNVAQGKVSFGGAMDIFLIEGKLIISENKIIGNSARARNSGYGGGICLSDHISDVIIENNYIANNSAYSSAGHSQGAGIAAYFAQPIIRNNIIVYNKTDYPLQYAHNAFGGGIAVFWNINDDWGWKVNPYSLVAKIENNTIAYNNDKNAGGGLAFRDVGSILKNNIIGCNFADNDAQIKVEFLSTAETKSRTLKIEYSNIEGGNKGISKFHIGIGNINKFPKYEIEGKWYLEEDNSPCIDAGDPSKEYEDLEDPTYTGRARFPALGTKRNDIGAFGGPNSKWAEMGIITNVEKEQINDIPNTPHLSQNYPNPFNPTTTIKYSLPSNLAYRQAGVKSETLPTGRQAENVKLLIFDVLGKEIITLVDQKQKAGNYEIKWNAENRPSGIYFYQLKTDNYSMTKKMIYIK